MGNNSTRLVDIRDLPRFVSVNSGFTEETPPRVIREYEDYYTYAPGFVPLSIPDAERYCDIALYSDPVHKALLASTIAGTIISPIGLGFIPREITRRARCVQVAQNGMRYVFPDKQTVVLSTYDRV